ncbi:MAG: porin [Polyangiaceae bacterium]
MKRTRPEVSFRAHATVTGVAALVSFLSIAGGAHASDADDVAIATGKPDPLNSTNGNQPTGKAGWYDGLFFLRDSSDNFRLYVQGRVHVDFYSYFGPGLGALPPGAELKTGFSLRRVRPELSGEFFHRWQWQLSAELGGTSSDNVGGTTDTSSCVPDNTGALVCTNQSAAVEAAAVKPAPTDAFVNYVAHPLLNLQVGQFLLPFSFENRMSDNTTPFMERNIVVRNIGAPNLRDIGAMVWGEPQNRLFYYSVGVFNGDGPNRLNADSRFDVFGRAFFRPFATHGRGSIRDAHIGVSARGGSRDSRLVGYDMPSMTTQGGYAFWKPTYRDSTSKLIHILPSTTQDAFSAEAFAPIGPIDATAEITYAASDTREAVDGFQLQNQNVRRGDLSGVGWYGQVAVWAVGDRSIIGFPSYGRPTHVDLDKPPPNRPIHALQLLTKFEQLRVHYTGNSRGGANDSKTPNGGVNVDDFVIGATYWATKHVRVSANYGFYVFSDRALWPGTGLVAKVDDSAKSNGHTLHEISARVGIQF